MSTGAVDVEIPLADAVRALRRELQEAIRQGEGEDLQFALGPVELELHLSISKDWEGQGGSPLGHHDRRRTEPDPAETHTVKLSLTPVTAAGSDVLVTGLSSARDPAE